MKRLIKLPPSYECPFCRHRFGDKKPPHGTRCPCGAVIGDRGWVFSPPGKPG